MMAVNPQDYADPRLVNFAGAHDDIDDAKRQLLETLAKGGSTAVESFIATTPTPQTPAFDGYNETFVSRMEAKDESRADAFNDFSERMKGVVDVIEAKAEAKRVRLQQEAETQLAIMREQWRQEQAMLALKSRGGGGGGGRRGGGSSSSSVSGVLGSDNPLDWTYALGQVLQAQGLYKTETFDQLNSRGAMDQLAEFMATNPTPGQIDAFIMNLPTDAMGKAALGNAVDTIVSGRDPATAPYDPENIYMNPQYQEAVAQGQAPWPVSDAGYTMGGGLMDALSNDPDTKTRLDNIYFSAFGRYPASEFEYAAAMEMLYQQENPGYGSAPASEPAPSNSWMQDTGTTYTPPAPTSTPAPYDPRPPTDAAYG